MARPFAAFVVSALAGAALVTGVLGASALAQQTAAPATPRPVAPQGPRPEPIIKGAHWHHIHMNVTDPAENVAFYTKHFAAKPARFANLQDAVWTQKSWMLFTKVAQAPDKKLNTAIWHIGWGTETPKDEYVRQQGLGAKFFQPLTDISTGLNGFRPDQFYYMYVEGPNRQLIELNTARHHNFGHMHMFSADPIAAGYWYIKFFGVAGRGLSTPQTSRAPVMNKTGEIQIGPSSSLNFDNVNMIIYPVEYSKKAFPDDWKGISELQSTRGHINDHFGVSVPNLDEALKAFTANGVKITQPAREAPNKLFRYAFIEGPDKIAIEIIEDHSTPPPAE